MIDNRQKFLNNLKLFVCKHSTYEKILTILEETPKKNEVHMKGNTLIISTSDYTFRGHINKRQLKAEVIDYRENIKFSYSQTRKNFEFIIDASYKKFVDEYNNEGISIIEKTTMGLNGSPISSNAKINITNVNEESGIEFETNSKISIMNMSDYVVTKTIRDIKNIKKSVIHSYMGKSYNPLSEMEDYQLKYGTNSK